MLKNTPSLEETIEFAKTEHAKASLTDKGGKTPYYWHLLRVMLRLQTDDIELMQIAILHDIVEDTPITLENLRERGYSERVIEGVKWSSKNMFDMTFANWMKAIGQEAPEDTIKLKIADISDNLGFERMQGLMKKSNHSKPHFGSHIEIDLRKKIDKKVEKKMRLSGEMGVFERYYKGWNYMFENSQHLSLIDKVFIDDFCHLKQLLSLSQYIPKEEMINYLSLNNIHTWKINGIMDIIPDRAGNGYVALKISSQDTIPYVNFLSTEINSAYLQNQQKRDRNHHHVTVINTMQIAQLRKNNPVGLKQFLDQNLHKNFDMFTYGIGKVEDNKTNDTAWFVVCENAELETHRNALMLPKQYFHITLAFNEKDVFSKPKDRTSIIYNNDILWNSFLEQVYHYQKKLKTTR